MSFDFMKILIPLMMAGIGAGGTAVVKVYTLEEKVRGQDKIMHLIYEEVKDIKTILRK